MSARFQHVEYKMPFFSAPPVIWNFITFLVLLVLDQEISLKNYNWFCKFSLGGIKFRDYRIHSNPNKQKIMRGRWSNLKYTASNLDVSICPETFDFLLNLASMIVLTIYGPVTRLSWPETRVKKIFLGQDYVMPYTVNKAKQKSLYNSFYLLMQVRSHKITRKTVVRWEKKTHTHTPRKDMVIFLLKCKSRALNRTLISFSFPHKFWFLSWSSIRHSTDYVHVWSQNTFFMAKKPLKMKPPSKCILDVNTWVVCDK